MAGKIRLAVFRVDNHLYFYAPLMAKIDVPAWRELSPETHQLHVHRYAQMEVAPKPSTAFEVTKIADHDPARAAEAARLFCKPPAVCEDAADLARDVDAAFIANCGDDGSDHRKLVEPLIRKGIPTLIDKPFAFETADAVAMVKLARKRRTPIYSTSLLSAVEQAPVLRSQFKRIGGVTGGVVSGACGWRTESGQEGVVHGVSLAQAVFGSGVGWVHCIGDHPGHVAALGFPGGLTVSLYLEDGIAGYAADVFGGNFEPRPRRLHTGLIDCGDFVAVAVTVVSRFKRMVRTGKPPRDYDEMIENIAVCEAVRRSLKLGRRVKISEVWKR